MDRMAIEGGKALRGEISIHGAKNAVLPILSAALLTPWAVIENCPQLTDVMASCRILEHLGCRVTAQDNTLTLDASEAHGSGISSRLTGEMRGSIVFLGALLAKFGRAQIALPGGCRLGPRPIDLHLSGLRQMGARIIEQPDGLICSVDGRLKGAKIQLRYPSVGATENLLIAAVLAQGETVVHGAAREPEIDSLIRFLQLAGAKIRRVGQSVCVEGVETLQGVEYRVIPDRIEAATYLSAAAATGGEISLRGVMLPHLAAILPVLEEMGCQIQSAEDTVSLKAPKRLMPVQYLATAPYPAFPTDALAPIMVPALLADGTSRFEETVFDGRYYHVDQLLSMGAQIGLDGRRADVHGVKVLKASALHCTDLRGGAALLTAALAAQGTSTLSRLEHLYRGYAQLLPTLRELGANVWLMTQDSVKSEDSCAYLARMDFDTVAEHAGRIAAI